MDRHSTNEKNSSRNKYECEKKHAKVTRRLFGGCLTKLLGFHHKHQQQQPQPKKENILVKICIRIFSDCLACVCVIMFVCLSFSSLHFISFYPSTAQLLVRKVHERWRVKWFLRCGNSTLWNWEQTSKSSFFVWKRVSEWERVKRTIRKFLMYCAISTPLISLWILYCAVSMHHATSLIYPPFSSFVSLVFFSRMHTNVFSLSIPFVILMLFWWWWRQRWNQKMTVTRDERK